MKKNGFVFVETIVVLVVLVVGMVSLYTIYSNIATNIEMRQEFDNISDLYKTNIVREYIDSNTISGTGLIEITSTNFKEPSKYTTLKQELNIEKIYINNSNIEDILQTSNISPNSLIEYLKTIRSESYERHIIVQYNYNDHNYYASLDL